MSEGKKDVGRVLSTVGKLFFGTAGLSTGAACAEVDPESGADTNAAAVVPRNCRRFIKHS